MSKQDTKFVEDQPLNSSIHRNAHIFYIAVIGVIFALFAVVFLCFPRTTYSELEKRDLASFPKAGEYSGKASQYTADVSQWFSDSEPYRDKFMLLSMTIRDALKYKGVNDEETISFRPNAPEEQTAAATVEPGHTEEEDLTAAENPMADESMKKTSSGIVVVGSGKNLRAFSTFNGNPERVKPYVDLVNDYEKAFPDVNIYTIVAPNQAEFYIPDKAKETIKPQKPVYEYIKDHINPRVKFVDVYSHLAARINEDIFLRTDHHWAPLGGYYAARAFAKVAQVPFKELDAYEQKVVHNYVGSMYGYSHDIAVKNAPEDFVYHLPKDVDYTATYVSYTLDKNRNIESESKPYVGKYFHEQKDGSGNAYCTFMGGDRHLVKVKTSTPGARKLLIIKDSYGNVLPGYLFHSFNEIHVADFRYFTRNMKEYVKDNGITDIVIANGIHGACSSGNMDKIRKFLTQPNGIQKAAKS